jgi:pimeloyl-ACP methyl ester carboxylesterase
MVRRLSQHCDYRTGWPNRLPPARAGDLAFIRFCTPKLSERRAADHDALSKRARFHLRDAEWITVPTTEGDIQTYVFAPDGAAAPKGNVLVVHGWTSEASFMAVIGAQLARAGFRAVLFDQPAHGKNRRERASLIDGTRALFQVAEALGPMRYAVAHSMGCLAVLLAGCGRPLLPGAHPFERFVLISGPNRMSVVTGEFGATLGLSAYAQRQYERRLERIAHRRLADFTGAKLLAATGRPALLIHARDDREVKFACAEEIVTACPLAEVAALDGLGHRNILHAPPAIRAALAYLTRS